MFGISSLIAILFTYFSAISCVPIDNGVEGDPEIECGPNTITVTFNTRNNFEGHVFVKGRYGEAGCRTDQSGKKTASISLPFSTCGVERQRSLNPKGIFIGVSVVITFHPQFLTKVDRAYSVQCFYMEADKTVSQDLEVSEITTAFQTQSVPMPVCKYDILDNGPNGEPIKYGVIGQQVYHKWTCETESVDIFCMLVHTCYVDDGGANRIQVINEQGCALDKYILNNLEYISDLMAGKEAHIAKFADKPSLAFQCQISISIKEPGEDCPRPKCPEPGGLGGAIPAGTVAPRQSTPSAGSAGSGIPPAYPLPPRTPPLGRSPPVGSVAPKQPTTPLPGSSPRIKSSPSAVPPSRSSSGQATPPNVALPVLANSGKPLPAPGSILPLSPNQTSRKPLLSSSHAPLPTTSRGPQPPAPLAAIQVTSTHPTTTSSSHPTTLASSSFAPKSPAETHAQPQVAVGTAAQPPNSAPAPAAPPAPVVAPAQPNQPGPFVTSVNLPAVNQQPPVVPSQPQNQPAPLPNQPQQPSLPNQPQPQAIVPNQPAPTQQPHPLQTAAAPLPAPSNPSPPQSQSNPPPPPPFAPNALANPNSASHTNDSRPGTTSKPAEVRFDFESSYPFRIRRVRAVNRVDFIGTWDVRAPILNAYEDFDHELTPGQLPSGPSPAPLTNSLPEPLDHLYCVPTVLIGLVIGVTLLSFLASLVVALFICLRRRGPKYYVD